ncbi:hypothetical protein T492DRAFT_140683 [Pavlovales sp. CCMP2436]|nr:hypothetical protein T492DRAFT_140683 [Pavlovales sp. CCMP2436]
MINVKVKRRRFKVPEVPHARWLQLREALDQGRRRRAEAFVEDHAVEAASAHAASAREVALRAADDGVADEAVNARVDEEALSRMRADLQRLQERKTELFTVLKEVLAQDERKRLQAAQAAKTRAESEAVERRALADEDGTAGPRAEATLRRLDLVRANQPRSARARAPPEWLCGRWCEFGGHGCAARVRGTLLANCS